MQFLNGLEIKYIYHEDEAHLGKKIANLAKLYHANLPIANGLILLPPIAEVMAIVNKLKLFSHAELIEREPQLKKKILNIKFDPNLKLKYKNYHFEKAWENLLLQWFSKLKSQIYLKEKIILDPKVIFFVHKPETFGSAFIDSYTKKLEYKVNGGNLSESQVQALEVLINSCDKNLVIHQQYEWIFDHGFKIIGVKPVSLDEPKIERFNQTQIVNQPQKKSVTKGSTKIFYDATDELSPDQDIDGIIIDSSFIDPEGAFDKRLERKIWKVVESCLSNYSLPVLYKLNKEKLKEDAEVVSFIRNKKQLLNLQIGLPKCRNSEELAGIKRELATFGLSRKGTLKIWLEFGTVENFINLDEYLEVGVDGIIINIDLLAESLYGGQSKIDSQKAANDIKKYLDSHLPDLKRASVPVLVFGSLLISDDLIRFLIEKKLWGVVINTSEQYGLKHYIHEVEKFFFKS